MDNYLGEFFGAREGWLEEGDGSQFARDWDQILTLPRRLTLRDRYEVEVEPAGAIASLRSGHRHVGRTVVAPNRELVLEDVAGDAIELRHRGRAEARVPVRGRRPAVAEPGGVHAHLPLPQERPQVPGTVSRRRSFQSGDFHLPVDPGAVRERRSRSTTRVPPPCPTCWHGRPSRHRCWSSPVNRCGCAIFVDRSVVEVFVNGRQCVAVRVYPGRRDSTGVSLISRGQESVVRSLDCWQMRSIYEPS